ncbi:MAG: hypothetical protein K6T34_05735, partial [Thermoflavifilum sp.]|nr:hypothetical protein [Thermoflavifilum sp.]
MISTSSFLLGNLRKFKTVRKIAGACSFFLCLETKKEAKKIQDCQKNGQGMFLLSLSGNKERSKENSRLPEKWLKWPPFATENEIPLWACVMLIHFFDTSTLSTSHLIFRFTLMFAHFFTP